MPKTVAVDFDNTLHPYTRGWIGPVPDDEPPIENAEGFLWALLDKGYHVAIYTTRADTTQGMVGTMNWFNRYMPLIHELLMAEDRVTISAGKPKAIAYVDDRAVPFDGNYNECLDAIAQLDTWGPFGGHRPNK